jgi:hypothetical protein
VSDDVIDVLSVLCLIQDVAEPLLAILDLKDILDERFVVIVDFTFFQNVLEFIRFSVRAEAIEISE